MLSRQTEWRQGVDCGSPHRGRVLLNSDFGERTICCRSPERLCARGRPRQCGKRHWQAGRRLARSSAIGAEALHASPRHARRHPSRPIVKSRKIMRGNWNVKVILARRKAYGLATTSAVRTKKMPVQRGGQNERAHSKIRRGAARSKLRFDSENFRVRNRRRMVALRLGQPATNRLFGGSLKSRAAGCASSLQ